MVMVRQWRRFLRPRGGQAALIVVASLACGCKTGTWGAKPSWWSSGGTAPGSALTAAPAFDKDPTKPSEVAKPYPTTNTPEGYALDGPAKASAPPSLAAAGAEPAAVTYGTTVAARAEPPASFGEPTPPASSPSSVAAQVGPYASLQQPAPRATEADPAAAAMAGFGAAPAFEAEPPPVAATTPPADMRVADARGSTGWPASTPAAAPAASTAGAFAAPESRYGQSTGSRFSGSGGYQPVAEPASPPAFEPAAAAAPFTPSLDPLPAAAPAVPAAAPAVSPALPGSLPPPTRRPDPGYRPGGTSSYRPNRAILADDESAGGIQPAGYELPAAVN